MTVILSKGRLLDYTVGGVRTVDPGVPLLGLDLDEVRENIYHMLPVRTVVDFIANQISTVPLKVYQRDKKEATSRKRQWSGPVADLLQNPTEDVKTASDFWSALLTDKLIYDRFLAVFIVEGERESLRRIPPRLWRTVPTLYDEVDEFLIFASDIQGIGEKVVKAKDGVFTKIGYCQQGTDGTPMSKTLRCAMKEYLASAAYRESINEGGFKASSLFMRDANLPWSPDARNKFIEGIKKFTDPESKSRSMLLEDGMKYQAVDAFKPIDVKDLEARERISIEAATAYGIPPELLGLRKGNFSNITAFKQMLFGTYLKPYILGFEQAINKFIVPYLQPNDNIYVQFDLDAAMRGDNETMYRMITTAVGGPWQTRNEGRQFKDLPAIAGGDELITPLNVTVGGQTSPFDGQTDKPAGISNQQTEED